MLFGEFKKLARPVKDGGSPDPASWQPMAPRTEAGWLQARFLVGSELVTVQIKCNPETAIDETADISHGCQIHPEAVIGAGAVIGLFCKIGKCRIAEGCRIAEQVKIEDGVEVGKQTFLGSKQRIQAGAKIGERCLIEGSDLQPGCSIGNDTTVQNGFVGAQAVIGNGVFVHGGSVIHGFAKISDGATLAVNSWIHEHEEVAAGAVTEPAPTAPGPREK